MESPTEALEVNGNISLGIDKSSSTRDNTYGNKLFFLGANRNTDDLWIARYNVMSSPNSSEVRLNLGDDPGHYGDKFVVGVTKTGIWYPKFSVSGNGNVGIGTTTPAYKLDVTGDIQIPDTLIHQEMEIITQEMDKKEIEIPEPIKHVGKYFVHVKLGPELDAKIKVKVSAQK